MEEVRKIRSFSEMGLVPCPRLCDGFWEDRDGVPHPMYEWRGHKYKFIRGRFRRAVGAIPFGLPVKVTSAGSRVRVVVSHSGKCPIVNLGNREFCLRKTGEVFKYREKSYSRANNSRTLKDTFQRARDEINANFSKKDFDRKLALWVTFTYKKSCYDYRQIESDFCAFRKRFFRYLKKSGLCSNFIYYTAVEAHGDTSAGGWHGFHLHSLFKFSSRAPFIDSNVLQSLWGLGFVKIVLADTQHFGEYLSAYVTNADASATDVNTTELKSNGKKYVKGARLFRCPARMRIFRHSRGLKKPREEKMFAGEKLYKKVEGADLTFSHYRVLEIGKYSMLYGVEVYTFSAADACPPRCEKNNTC